MSFNLTTSGAIINKAGANASATAIASYAFLAEACDEAEAEFNALTRYDWVTNWASVKTQFQKQVSSSVAARAAMEVVNYDFAGYPTTAEAQTKLDFLRDVFMRGVEWLREMENKEKLI